MERITRRAGETYEAYTMGYKRQITHEAERRDETATVGIRKGLGVRGPIAKVYANKIRN